MENILKKFKCKESIGLYIFAFVCVFLVIIGFYAWHFQGYTFGSAEAFGQFGDYLGGILNPVIALFSFLFLFKNFKEQKEFNAKQIKSQREQYENDRLRIILEMSRILKYKYAMDIKLLSSEKEMNLQDYLRVLFCNDDSVLLYNEDLDDINSYIRDVFDNSNDSGFFDRSFFYELKLNGMSGYLSVLKEVLLLKDENMKIYAELVDITVLEVQAWYMILSELSELSEFSEIEKEKIRSSNYFERINFSFNLDRGHDYLRRVLINKDLLTQTL